MTGQPITKRLKTTITTEQFEPYTDWVPGVGVDKAKIVCTYANHDCTPGDSDCSVPGGRRMDCEAVEEIIPLGEYHGIYDNGEDFAVLRLKSDLTDADVMYMSKRATALLDFNIHATRGYPSGTPDDSTDVCDINSLPQKEDESNEVDNDAKKQYFANGDIDAVLSSTINFLMSSAAGMSGGAMYYCWTGDCDEGAGQTSIQSLYTSFSLNGPRSKDFRSAVLAEVES